MIGSKQSKAVHLANSLESRRSNTIRENTKEENAAIVAELRRLDAENSDLRERNAAMGNAQEIALDTATEHALAADELRSALTAAETERDQLRAQVERLQATEPFGYFHADPMGWTDCAETDEGAIALYERPAAPAVPDVMSILRAIHRRPSDAGIWLDDITRILRDAHAPAVPNVLKRGYGRLIQAAADLALQQFMPSDIVDDYPSKTISAAKVAKMMTQPRDRLRLLSIEVSEGAKQMLAATPAAPSQPSKYGSPELQALIVAHATQEPVTLTGEGNRALQVMRWIDSGEWTLTKSRPSSLLTDEANAERAWFVERQAEPYCDNKGNRRWFGCTAFEAFTIAIAALREKEALR